MVGGWLWLAFVRVERTTDPLELIGEAEYCCRVNSMLFVLLDEDEKERRREEEVEVALLMPTTTAFLKLIQ